MPTTTAAKPRRCRRTKADRVADLVDAAAIHAAIADALLTFAETGERVSAKQLATLRAEWRRGMVLTERAGCGARQGELFQGMQ